MGDFIDNLKHDTYIPDLDGEYEDYLDKWHGELNDTLEESEPGLKKIRCDLNLLAEVFSKAKYDNNIKQVLRLRKKISDLENERALIIHVLEPDIEVYEQHREILEDPNDTMLEAIWEGRL